MNLLKDLEIIAEDINDRWDSGMKSGKLLAALAGRVSNYRADVTRVRQLLDVKITVKTMALSDGRSDYFVAIIVGDREVTPYASRHQYQMEYEAASLRWLLLGGKKPDLMAYSPNGWPGKPVEETASTSLKSNEEG